MQDGLEFKELRAADLAEAAALYQTVFAAPPWSETWEPALVRARLEQVMQTPGGLGLALWEGSTILAFALGFTEPWIDSAHLYLKEICVRPERQKSGLGRRLMNELERRVSEQGVSKIYLLTTRGEGAEAFYQRLGYYTSERMIMMARRLER